jgi:uncharacterized protein (TIGR02246 family)
MEPRPFDQAAMIRTQRAVVAALKDRDPVAFANLYTEDGTLYPPDGSTHRGRAQIESAFAGMLAAGFSNQTVRDVELLVDDRLAVEEGLAVAEFTRDGLSTTGRAHYVVIHQRQEDGGWLMWRDIWTAIPEATTAPDEAD